MAAANPKEVSVRAGHRSAAFTLDRYGHLFPGHDRELRRKLDAFFEAADAGYEEGDVIPFERDA